MKVKTIELTGSALDWAVAKSEGRNPSYYKSIIRATAHPEFPGSPPIFGPELNYSTDWAQGGPIIEREDISIIRLEDDYLIDSEGFCTNKRIPVFGAVIGRCFDCETLRNSYGEDCGSVYIIESEKVITGPTSLIAAMRCYVLSKLGDTVDIPDELL